MYEHTHSSIHECEIMYTFFVTGKKKKKKGGHHEFWLSSTFEIPIHCEGPLVRIVISCKDYNINFNVFNCSALDTPTDIVERHAKQNRFFLTRVVTEAIESNPEVEWRMLLGYTSLKTGLRGGGVYGEFLTFPLLQCMSTGW